MHKTFFQIFSAELINGCSNLRMSGKMKYSFAEKSKRIRKSGNITFANKSICKNAGNCDHKWYNARNANNTNGQSRVKHFRPLHYLCMVLSLNVMHPSKYALLVHFIHSIIHVL